MSIMLLLSLTPSPNPLGYVASPKTSPSRTPVIDVNPATPDIIPLILTIKNLLPLGFLYGWWPCVCTLAGVVVGSGVQMAGLWDMA